EIPVDFPHIVGDRNRLTQILFNLIHNAIKYTNEGTITISADVDNDRAYINISDSGIGMSKETMERIFEPYEQSESSMISSSGGLGLGLSICRQLVDLHGGTLHADSIL